MNAYIVLASSGDYPHAEVIGPFLDKADADNWFSQHENDLEDWESWTRDIRGGIPQVIGVDELTSTRPDKWLAGRKELIEL